MAAQPSPEKLRIAEGTTGPSNVELEKRLTALRRFVVWVVLPSTIINILVGVAIFAATVWAALRK